jgi:hypothetical protein
MSSLNSLEPIQIIINASPETLYNHLVDFRNHVAWNRRFYLVGKRSELCYEQCSCFV